MRKWYVLFLLLIAGVAGFSTVIPAVAQEMSPRGSVTDPLRLLFQGTPPPVTTPPPGSPQGTPPPTSPPATTPPPGSPQGTPPPTNPPVGTPPATLPPGTPPGSVPPGTDPASMQTVGAPDAPGTGTPDATARLPRFGDEFFNVSRRAIAQARSQIATGGNSSAFSGPAGPVNLGNVGATPPETYQLGPGDKLTLRVSSATLDPSEAHLAVDNLGYITIPQSGKRIVVVGQTLASTQKIVTESVQGYIRNAQVTLTLDELRTFTVTILGESFAPGAYQVPATFTLFNLILATGGPSERGSLRNIQLRRNNSPVRNFDLYRFLIFGDAKQDIPLQPGDVVFFNVQQGQVEVSGEVNRPASYELKGGESLSDVLALSGGIRPSGVSQNVAIDSVIPGVQRQLLNVNVTKKVPASNPVVRDGDRVQVFSIRSDIRNSVSIEGPVELPRTYAYQKGMKVSTLVSMARGLLPAADRTVAEVKRMNPDGSRKLIRINLTDALKKVPTSDITLMPEDALKIFDVNDVAWRGDRQVRISGAIRKPDVYYRADGMRLADLIRTAKGLTPDAYTEEARVQRYLQDGSPGPLLRVNLMKAALGDPKHDIVLNDRDQVRIYKLSDWKDQVPKNVEIVGAVQRPGSYPLAVGMTVKDLLQIAGNITLTAEKENAYLQRINEDGTPGPLILVNPTKAIAGDPQSNLPLRAQDQLKVYTINQWKATVDLVVDVDGAVQRPGSFPYAPGMSVKDLIEVAGNFTLTAEKNHAYLQRTNDDGTPGPIFSLNPSAAISGDESSNIKLRPRDRLSLYTTTQWQATLDQEIKITGAIQRPGQYRLGSNMRVKDLIELAGNFTLDANKENAFLQRINEDGTLGPVILLDPTKALLKDPQSNVPLKPRDVLKIYTKDEWRATPAFTVDLVGAVQRPGSFGLAKDMTVRDLINLAGGPTLDAYLPQAFLQRTNLDGTLGALVLVNVEKALAGDSANNVLLESRDKLTIYKKDQAKVYATRTVKILGGVQRPGEYPRGEGMTLASLIDLAGGLLPNSEKFAIIAASDSPEGQDVDRVPVESGATRLIRDKDLVTVPIDSSILADPIQVVIQGAVKNPGTYFFTRKDQRFTDLVKQAGGLRPEAWVDGIQFSRRPDLLKTNAQVTQQPRLLEVLTILQVNEYKRALAKAQADRLVFLGTTAGSGSAFEIPSLVGGSAATSAAAAAGALAAGPTSEGAGELVTPARQGSDLFSLIGGNMDIRATAAFKNPNAADNVVLKPGDVVTVPEMPSTVLVDGPGSVLPRAFVFEPGRTLRDYIVKAGGVTSDADTERIIILRPTGSITRPSPGTRIELGDVIYVPTKVMVSPLGGRVDVFDRTVKTITSAALIYGIFRSLVK